MKAERRIYYCFFILFVILLIFNGCSDTNSSKIKYKNNWALYNYGQTISGTVGVKGIDVNMIPSEQITAGNNNIIVAVVDTGADISCDVLKSKILLNDSEKKDGIDNDSNGFIDDLFGWNFYNNSKSVFDDYLYDYHGTYICTTISSVSPKVKILPVKFLNGTSGSVKNAISAIKYAISRGAKIINCSWNFTEYNIELYKIIAGNPSVLFVCSAGNSNIDLDKNKIYPCSYDLNNIITVIAVDNQGKLYNASGYGKSSDIAAPGKSISVILPENDTDYVDGTSVATAFVTSAAALMYSVNNNLTPKDIKKYINSSAHKLDTLKSLCLSGGILDIDSAINLCRH